MAKACRADVRKAIIKTAAKRMNSELFSPLEGSDDTFVINNSARKVQDEYNTKRNDILNEAKKDILKVNKAFKDRIRAVLVKTDDTSDIQVMIKVDPLYVENEFSKLPEDRRNNVFVDLEEDQPYFEQSQSIFEQDFTEGFSQTDLDNLFSYTKDIDEVDSNDLLMKSLPFSKEDILKLYDGEFTSVKVLSVSNDLPYYLQEKLDKRLGLLKGDFTINGKQTSFEIIANDSEKLKDYEKRYGKDITPEEYEKFFKSREAFDYTFKIDGKEVSEEEYKEKTNEIVFDKEILISAVDKRGNNVRSTFILKANGDIKEGRNTLEKENFSKKQTSISELTGKVESPSYNEQRQYYSSKNVSSLLENIVKFATDADTKSLAQALLKVPKINSIPLTITKYTKDLAGRIEDSPDALGTYRSGFPELITVIGNLPKNTFETVFLHELIHGVTVNEYYKNKEFSDKIDALYNYALKFKDYNTSKGITLGQMYGMKNVREFMAEAMSNPDFIYELSKYYSPTQEKLKQKNIFQEFINLVVDVIKEKLTSKNKKYIEDNLGTTVLNTISNYAKVKSSDIVSLSKFEELVGVAIKPGVQELFDSNPELANQVYKALGFVETAITLEQKKQALQEYSFYLDSIFPDSDFKDIVYHGRNKGQSLDLTIYEEEHDVYFAPNKEDAEYWGARPGKVGYLNKNINPSSFGLTINGKEATLKQKKEYIKKLFEVKVTPAIINNPTIDTTSTEDRRNLKEYSGKPEQIHILGTEKDIKKFKAYIENVKQNVKKDLIDRIERNYFITLQDEDARNNFEEAKAIAQEINEQYGAEIISLKNKRDEDGDWERVINIPDFILEEEFFERLSFDFDEAEEMDRLEREAELRLIDETEDDETEKSIKDSSTLTKFVEDKTLPEEEKPATQEEKNKLLNSKVYEFLGKIGVSIVTLDTIRDADGNIINATAKADMLNKVIQVVEGNATIDTLSEEAAHFFVAMLGEGHPLYKEMFDKIEGYEIYQTTLQQYKNMSRYRLPNGDVNYDKIKKEAIGKVIAQHIINMDPAAETDANLETLYNWWQKLWEFVTDIFNRSTDNPFEEAAVRILMGETEGLSEENLTEKDDEYYQLTDPIQLVLQDQNTITLDNSVDPRTGQKRHIYYYGGVQGKGSVTSVYVDRWLKKIFRTDNRTEIQKKIDLMKAEFGDIVHEQIQDIVKSWTNPDGTRKSSQDAITPNKGVGKAEFTLLNNYISEILDQYDVGTRFFAEMKIFDKKTQIAGSIDLLVIEPDGTVEIYDWKTQEIFTDQTDIKTYKEPMYRIQLNAYRDILEAQYGFKKFGRIRAFPIATNFTYSRGSISGLKSIEIGSLDLESIPEDKSYLLPVALRTESTGDSQLDNLIEKLYAIYDKIQNQKNRYTKEEVFKKREELSQFRTAIRDLQLRNKIERFVELGAVQIKKYTDELDNKTLRGGHIPEALSTLKVFSESGVTLYELRQELLASIDKEDTDAVNAFKEMNEKFLLMTSKASKLISDIEEYRREQTDELGKRNGIFNILNPEQAVGTLKGWFASLSNIKQKSFRVFSKLLRNVQNIRDAKFDEASEKLLDLKKGVAQWASSKGMSIDKAMEMILNIDEKGKWNGNFLSTYDKGFYTERDIAIKENNYQWLSENLQYNKEKYEAAEKKQREFFKSVVYNSDEEENEVIVNKKIQEWISFHRVILPNGKINPKALMNPENRFLRPKDKWFTEKWRELNKKENKPLKDAYDYFRSLTKQAESNGMIDKFSPHFIPSVLADKMDQLVFGDIKTLFSGKGTFENLEVDSGTQYTPETDPTTGQIINRVPVYFTRDMGVKNEETGEVDYSKKSRDLFKVFGVWASHMYNFEAMSSIEDDALMLVEVEKDKSSLVVDGFGRIVKEGSRIKQTEENRRNSELLENFVNYYLYDRTNGAFKDVAFKNPFSKSGKEYSLLKTMGAAIRFFSLKTLGLNFASGTANFVGGTGNALFTSQKGILFTKKGWANAMYKVTSQDKKAMAALDYMNVLLEGRQRQLINELSLSSTNQILNSDNLFVIQRTSDKVVQYPVAIAVMENSMIRDGKLVDITAYVKEKYDYNNTFYNLSSSERSAMMNKIEQEVTELKEKESILAIGKLDEKGKFSIPGVNKTESGVYGELRDKIKATSKKILGNSSRDDINSIRTTMLGSALMQFRNWMPEMIEDRMAGLQYDDELGIWTYGRMNQWVSQGFWKNTTTMLKSIVTGFGDDAIKTAKDSYERMKRDAYEKGDDFDITEGEFIDMYIGNLRSMGTELLILMGFTLLILSVVAGTGDDDDKGPKGMKSYVVRVLKKYYGEFAFYFNPIEFTKLTKSPLPVIGLAEDFFRFGGNLLKEGAGQLTGNEDWMKSAKPLKYLFRALPIAKEALLMMAAFDDEFRKEWDIQLKPGGSY